MHARRRVSEPIAALRDTPSGGMRVATPGVEVIESERRVGGPRETVPTTTLASAEDAAVVERIVAGDQRAEAELFRRYAPLIARTAERLLRSRHDAQDVLQDTFVIALEQLARLRDRSALRGWLLQIAIRQVHRRFRRRRLRQLLGFDEPEPDARLDQLADRGASPDVVAELALLDRALASIAPMERMAWMLRRVEGHPLDQVAKACRCSLATAKRRVAAADAIVNTHLELGGDDDG